MVKLGFIVEGDTEKIILESPSFKELLDSLKISYVSDIINVEGCNNLLPYKIKENTEILHDKGATKIVILTDLDKEKCVTETKARIKPLQNHICIVSKKEIEAWFLSDTVALRNFIQHNIDEYNNPEEIVDPFEEIRKAKINKTGRGFTTKRKLAHSMIKSGFSIKRAAEHPHCTSAKYFIDKLKSLVGKN